MITQRTIEEIKSAVNIEEVISEFVPLKRAGKSWVGKCPFHDDHSPSMHVTPHLGIYKCFVCDAKGDAVHFLMEHEKISYPEALRYLANKYHIDIEEDKRVLTPEQEAANNERDALMNVNEYAEKFFIDQLNNTEEGQNIGLTYFCDKRGFQMSTIKKFKLGYCPSGWDAFTQEAQKNGYKLEYLLKLGLTKKAESGKLFDFYHGRVIFPIHNALGKPIGFGGRVMEKDAKTAKYFNSPESEIYHKSDVLYGFYFAKKAIRTLDNAYLVEGYTDVISMHEAGVENVVASSGTALTEGQINLIKAQTHNITVLYDGDKPGIKASLRGINMLIAAGLNVRAVLLPDGEDPDSFAKAHRDSELQQYLTDNAVSIIRFKYEILSQDVGNDPLRRAEMVDDILGTIAEVKDPLKQSYYVEECAELTGRAEDILRANLQQLVWKRINQQNRQSSVQAAQQQSQATQPQLPSPIQPEDRPHQQLNKENLDDITELSVLKFILQHGLLETHLQKIDEKGEPYLEPIRTDQYIFNEFYFEEIKFQNPLYQRIFDEYARIAQKTNSQEELMRAFAQHEDPAIQNAVIPLLMEDQPDFSPQWEEKYEIRTNRVDNSSESLNRELTGCISLFKMRLIEKQKQLLTNELANNHPVEVERQILDRLRTLNERYRELSNMIHLVIPR